MEPAQLIAPAVTCGVAIWVGVANHLRVKEERREAEAVRLAAALVKTDSAMTSDHAVDVERRKNSEEKLARIEARAEQGCAKGHEAINRLTELIGKVDANFKEGERIHRELKENSDQHYNELRSDIREIRERLDKIVRAGHGLQ